MAARRAVQRDEARGGFRSMLLGQMPRPSWMNRVLRDLWRVSTWSRASSRATFATAIVAAMSIAANGCGEMLSPQRVVGPITRAQAVAIAEQSPEVRHVDCADAKLASEAEYYANKAALIASPGPSESPDLWVVLLHGDLTPTSPGAGPQPWAYVPVNRQNGRRLIVTTYHSRPSDWASIPDHEATTASGQEDCSRWP